MIRSDHNAFVDAFSLVTHFGAEVPSRYGATLELPRPLNVTFDAGMLLSRPKINYGLGWMELLQLLAGIFDPKALVRMAPNAQHNLFTFQMAYGPRIYHRMPAIIMKLQEDPGTRQAVLFIGHPDDGPTSDLPCTISIQFLIRFGTMRANVSMRSWDLVKGMAYDVMMFGGLTLAAGWLDIVTWSRGQVTSLQKGQTPEGIIRKDLFS
jgi:hypothetical protein